MVEFANVSTVTIPDKVYSNNIQYTITAIGEYCFDTCTTVTEFILNKSLKTLQKASFISCINLETINLSNIEMIDSDCLIIVKN
jgi:hypothetical protein